MAELDPSSLSEHQLLQLLVAKLTGLENRVGQIEKQLGLKPLPPATLDFAAVIGKAPRPQVAVKPKKPTKAKLTDEEFTRVERLLVEGAWEFDPRRLLSNYQRRVELFCQRKQRRPDGLLDFAHYQRILGDFTHFKSLQNELYDNTGSWRDRFERFCRTIRERCDSPWANSEEDWGLLVLASASQFNAVVCGGNTKEDAQSEGSLQNWDQFKRAYESRTVESISLTLAMTLKQCEDVVTDLKRVDVLSNDISSLRKLPLDVAALIVDFSGFDRTVNSVMPVFEKAMPWVLQRLSEGIVMHTLKDYLIPEINRVFCAQLICHKIMTVVSESIEKRITKRGTYFKRAVEWMDQVLESEMERVSLKGRNLSWGKRQRQEMIDFAHSVLEFDSTLIVIYDFLARLFGFFWNSITPEELIHHRVMPAAKQKLLKKRFELMSKQVMKQEDLTYNKMRKQVLSERPVKIVKSSDEFKKDTDDTIQLLSSDEHESADEYERRVRRKGRKTRKKKGVITMTAAEMKSEESEWKPMTFEDSKCSIKVKRSLLFKMLQKGMNYRRYKAGGSLAKFVRMEDMLKLERDCENVKEIYVDDCCELILDKSTDDEVAAGGAGITLLELEIRRIFVDTLDYDHYQRLVADSSADFGALLQSFEVLSDAVRKIKPEMLTVDYVYTLILVLTVTMKLSPVGGGSSVAGRRRRKNPRQMKAFFNGLEYILQNTMHPLHLGEQKHDLMFAVFLDHLLGSLKEKKYLDMMVDLIRVCCVRWKPGFVLSRMLCIVLEWSNVTATQKALDVWVELINEFTVSSFDSLLGVCLFKIHEKMIAESKVTHACSTILSAILMQCGVSSKTVVLGPFVYSKKRSIKREVDNALLILAENRDTDYVLRKRLSVYL